MLQDLILFLLFYYMLLIVFLLFAYNFLLCFLYMQYRYNSCLYLYKRTLNMHDTAIRTLAFFNFLMEWYDATSLIKKYNFMH